MTKITKTSALSSLDDEQLMSLGDRAYQRIRAAIIDGSLPSDTQISERSLALSLGISAQPVREAMQRLELEGMIVSSPRRGSMVADFGLQRLEEMGLIRIGLEGTAANLAARRATVADVKLLLDHLRFMTKCTRENDIKSLAEANAGFHDRIHMLTGSTFLRRSLEAVRGHEDYGRVRILRSAAMEPSCALREHASIVAAIRRHDPALAEMRMRAHVERSLITIGLIMPPTVGRRQPPHD